MQLATLMLTAVLAVPPNQQPRDHTQPYHFGAPVIRRFERREDDDFRHRAWDAYVRELDSLWVEYRRAGSTARAWEGYKRAVGQAKRGYVYRDIYLVPVTELSIAESDSLSEEERQAPPPRQ